MKRTLLASVLMVMACIPSAAWAVNTPELTYPTGTTRAINSKLRAVNVGEIKFTSSSGNTVCTSASLKGTLNKNTGTELEASFESSTFAGAGGDGRCVGPSQYWVRPSLSWCLRSTPELTEDEFHIRGAACSKTNEAIKITFTKPVPLLECIYERSPVVSGTDKTYPEDALLTAEPEYSKVGGALSCPSTTKIDTSLTFERDEGLTNPLYISAGPRLTNPVGVTLPAGTKIRARNVGEIKITTGFTMTCSSAEMTGTLQKNNGTEIEASIESASFTGTGTEGTCTSSFGNTEWVFNSATNGLPWCLRATAAMSADTFQLRGNNCAGASRPIRLVVQSTTVAECIYERKAAIEGTYTTHPEDAALKFTDSTLLEAEPRQATCPDETQMDATLTLEAEETGTHPMYID
jgi:hypothetical protein